ncbi:MAG: hypothetical protein NC402_02195 [Prevotella sp.]|nr:hypothetical protein [Prevotella sp.]MCM1074610.1 hypothetical protein [Ruminococcus sp.]
MKLSTNYAISIICIFFILSCKSSAFPKKIETKIIKQTEFPTCGHAHVGIPYAIDSIDNNFSKVIYKIGSIKIVVAKEDSLIKYIPIINNLVDERNIRTFTPGQLKKFSNKTSPKIMIDKNLSGDNYDIYIRPFTFASFNDSRINEFPLEWIRQNSYTAQIDNTNIQIHVYGKDRKYVVKVPDRYNRILNGVRTKELYSENDTIPLNNIGIFITSINECDSTIAYNIIEYDKINKVHLPDNIKAYLSENFAANKLTLIEFFGT